MAIHAPAHRPAVHFHLAMPHAGGWVNDILTTVATGVVALAIALALSAVLNQNGYFSGTRAIDEPYQSAVSAATYDGSAAMAAVTIRSQPLTPEARSLLLYRADERTLAGTEAQSLLLFRAGERGSAVTRAETLDNIRLGR